MRRQKRDSGNPPSVGMRDDMLLVPKLRQLFCLRTRLESPRLWQTAIDHFHFRNNEAGEMLVYQSNPVGIELFRWFGRPRDVCKGPHDLPNESIGIQHRQCP